MHATMPLQCHRAADPPEQVHPAPSVSCVRSPPPRSKRNVCLISWALVPLSSAFFEFRSPKYRYTRYRELRCFALPLSTG